MSSNNYQIYINQTLQLAATIVIKSTYAAEAINLGLMGSSGYLTSVDPDPTTWKYYLNLAGEYHSSDAVMTVVSLDTLETIVFNKSNLRLHTATSRAYQYGTRQYTELVAAYPDQESLILGILYPTDLQTAINAPDGCILSFPPNLVESNEYNLMNRLQEWIYQYKQRWYVNAFDLTDELYHATHLGIMYLLLVQALLTYRLKACNTHEAHSFHVKQYLGSHGFLDQYTDSMTTKQALFFYRNIAFIERNVGKRDTFDTLTDHIMTERSIPLAEYTMKHDVTNQPENLYSGVFFRKRQLNLGFALDPNNETTLPQLLNKELGMAPGNVDELDLVTAKAQVLMENSPSNVVATKVVESSMVDESNSTPWTLTDILFNEWIDLSSKGLYTTYINITNPITGDKLPLTAKEAFVLAMYAYAKTLDRTLDTVPYAYANHVQRTPTVDQPNIPSVDDIYSIVDNTLITRDVAEQALSIQPVIKPLISTDAFYTLCLGINDAIQMQRYLTAWQEHYQRRGMVANMCSRIYCDNIVALEPEGTKYGTWLSDRSINLDAFQRDDFELLYTNIVAEATGIALHPTQSLKELQSKMVKMFTQLSSYGIQVIAEINDSTIRKTDWPGVRLGDIRASLSSRLEFPDSCVETVKALTKVTPRINVDLLSLATPRFQTEVRYRLKSDIHLNSQHSGTKVIINVKSNVPKIKVRGEVPANLPRGWVPFIGIENILSLTPEQLVQIRDVYTGGIDITPPGLIPLAQVILIPELIGLTLDLRQEQLERTIIHTLLGKTYPE